MMSSLRLDNFLQTTRQLYRKMDEGVRNRCNHICAKPVLSVPAEIFDKFHEKFIELLRAQDLVPRRLVIVGYNNNIVALLQDFTVEESLIDLTIRCRFCLQIFVTFSDWLGHINDLECMVSNPYHWFPQLSKINSTNHVYGFGEEREKRRRVMILNLDNEEITPCDPLYDQNPDTDEEHDPPSLEMY